MSGMPSKVLVVDDEMQIRRFLRASLVAHDCEVVEAATGEEGLKLCAVEEPDAVVLDLILPDVNGLEILKRLREWSQVPVIVLSAQDGDKTIIEALDVGADDFVTKPFKMAVFIARLRATCRNSRQVTGGEAANSSTLESGELTLDHAQHKCWVNDEEVALTPKEFELLSLLMKHEGKVLTHKMLLETVWGPANVDDREYLRVFIKQLRDKIEADPAKPKRILTEPGVGYRLSDPNGEKE